MTGGDEAKPQDDPGSPGLDDSRLTSLVSAVRGVLYDWDVALDRVVRSEGLLRLLGIATADALPTAGWWRSRIHPSDLDRLSALVDVPGGHGRVTLEYRLRHEAGHWIDVLDDAEVECDAAGRPVRIVGHVVDIGDRKRVERQWHESEERLRRLVENIDDVFWVVDFRNQRQLYVSPSYETRWGFSREALYRGQPRWLDRMHPDDVEPTKRAFEAVPPDGHFEARYRIVRDDGSVRWIEDRGSPVLAGDGGIERVMGVAIDITDDLEARTLARDRGERLQLAIDAADLHVWSYDPAKRRLQTLEPLCKVFGLPIKHCSRLGPWRRRIHPDDRAMVETAFRGALAGLRRFAVTFRVFRGSGSVIWLDAHAVLTEEPGDAGVRTLLGVAADVTERKAREQALSESEAQLRQRERDFTALVENAPDVIARLSRRGRFLYANRAVSTTFGLDASAFIGRKASDIGFPRHVSANYLRAVRRALRSGDEQTFDFRLDGTVESATRSFEVRIVPEFDAAGRVESALAITYDVTARARVEAQRDALLEREKTARADAEAASRARDQFLAMVSHELRSPLNGIQSWSHVLENQIGDGAAANPVALRALQGIRSGVQQQVRLIEDLLDATRAITGELRLTKGPFRVREVIEGAAAAAEPAMQEKNLHFHVSNRLDGERIDGDASRVGQLLRNLLSNAAKFTPANGNVWLGAHALDGLLHVSVRDDGRGISQALQHALFDPFRQADSSNTRGTGGIGLGLTLSRQLALLHGGTIEVTSDGENRGATFRVRLPLLDRSTSPDGDARDQPAAIGRVPDEQPVPMLDGMSALVIDDQLEAREALTALLSQFGVVVTVAASGRTGLDFLRRDATARPDVVICDIAMPGEDGYAFLSRLRELEATSSPVSLRTPVIALSAFAPDAGRKGSPKFDAYLAKPVSADTLLATIFGVAHSASGGLRPR